MENNEKRKNLIMGIIAVAALVISILVYTFVSADTLSNKIKVKTAKISSIKTGTATFDDNDGLIDNTSVENYIAGNDASEDNRIVRSFDTVTYNFNFLLGHKEDQTDFSERTVDIYVELTEEEARYVTFDTDSLPGERTYTYHFDGIDSYGAFDKSITLYVLGAPNGTNINPKFVIKESTDEDAGVSLGKVSSTDNFYSYDNDTYTTTSVFQNYLPIVVSSKPATIGVDTLTTTESQKSTLDGKVGRYITFVSGIYIEGDPYKGIKGLDMPAGDISFNSTISQDGNSAIVTNENWARLYSINNVNEIESVVVDLPYSTGDSNDRQKEVSVPGNMTVSKTDNTFNVTVRNYNINQSFPSLGASGSATGNKYYIGTYAFTGFSPRVTEDGKNTININYSMNSISMNGTNGESYSISDSTLSNTNEYYQSSDYSYDSGLYTEDDNKLNSETAIGSVSKGTNVIYKTTFNYKKTLSDEGIKEVIKVNPYAFRVLNYSTNDIVDIDVKCGESDCTNISKDDFEIKLISGSFDNSNYIVGAIDDKINPEDRDTIASSCASLDLSSYSRDQILNLYGGPCITPNGGIESVYSSISDAVNSDGSEDVITKVVVQTKEGVYLPDNAVVTAKVRLRVRDVPDLTRVYQVATTISSSDYDTVKKYYYPSSYEVTNPDNYVLPTIEGSRVINIHNVSFADSIRIASYTSDQEISVLNKNSDGTMKVNYNAVDNETITYSIKPILEDHSENSNMDDTWFIKYLSVIVTLPENLTFIPDSDESKYFTGYSTYNGVTYLSFELPFTKPNMVIDNVTFKAKINSKIKGSSVPIEITSNLYAYNVNDEMDSSLFGESSKKFTIYGNGVDNVIVEQKVGSAGTLVEKNTEFSYLLTAYNNTNNIVEDYQIVDILPANGDTNGSTINGTYTTKLVVPASLGTAKIYCSTQNYEDLVKEIDSGNIWENCSDIKDNYKSVTAIKVTDIAIDPDTYMEPIELIIKPQDNSFSDKYINDFIGGSATYSKNTSNKISIGVVSRSISGKVFNDNNENGVQDDKDTYVSGIPVTLYRVENEDDIKVAETVTDANGKYMFNNLEVGKYFIDLNYNGTLYDLTRRYATMDEKVDSDAYKISDTIARISNKRTPDNPYGIRVTREDISLENYDMGLIPRRSFGFDMKKYITKIDLNYNGTTNTTNYNNETKVLLSVKNSLRATAKVYYGIAITNDSTRAGYVNEVEESIPEGLIFDQTLEENKDWILINGKLINTSLSDTVISPGETKYLQIVLFMPTRETAGTFLNTVSIIDMTEYEEETLAPDATYTNTHGYVVGESVDYAGVSWHVIDTTSNGDGSQDVTLLADSGTISDKYAHSYNESSVYMWSDSFINSYINNVWQTSLDKSVLHDISICNDASGLEVASYGGNISGACQSNLFTTSKIRLLTREEYIRLTTSYLSNIDWLTGNEDFWLQSSDDTRPVYNMFGTEPSDSYGDISTSSYNKASYVSSTGIKTDFVNRQKEIRPVITITSNNILFE